MYGGMGPNGGLLLDPAPGGYVTALSVAAQIGQKLAEKGAERLGASHATARSAGFISSALLVGRPGALLGGAEGGIGAVPGAILGGVIGGVEYGFNGLTEPSVPQPKPLVPVYVDPLNPYPTGSEWGDPTAGL